MLPDQIPVVTQTEQRAQDTRNQSLAESKKQTSLLTQIAGRTVIRTATKVVKGSRIPDEEGKEITAIAAQAAKGRVGAGRRLERLRHPRIGVRRPVAQRLHG